MAKYSDNEREFFQTLLADFEIREDGRSKTEQREYYFIHDFLPSTFSSLKLVYSKGQREIIFAVKGEIVKGASEKLLSVSLESMYKIEDQRTKSEIEDFIESLIFKSIKPTSLRVADNSDEFYWKFYVDIFVLDTIKFPIFQFISIGTKVLLQNIKVPKIVVFRNQLSGETEYDLLENYEDVSTRDKMRHFRNLKIPDVYCLGLYKNNILLDPSDSEFSVSDSLIIVSTLEGQIEKMQSIGSSIDLSKIQEITTLVKTLVTEKMDEN